MLKPQTKWLYVAVSRLVGFLPSLAVTIYSYRFVDQGRISATLDNVGQRSGRDPDIPSSDAAWGSAWGFQDNVHTIVSDWKRIDLCIGSFLLLLGGDANRISTLKHHYQGKGLSGHREVSKMLV